MPQLSSFFTSRVFLKESMMQYVIPRYVNLFFQMYFWNNWKNFRMWYTVFTCHSTHNLSARNLKGNFLKVCWLGIILKFCLKLVLVYPLLKLGIKRKEFTEIHLNNKWNFNKWNLGMMSYFSSNTWLGIDQGLFCELKAGSGNYERAPLNWATLMFIVYLHCFW